VSTDGASQGALLSLARSAIAASLGVGRETPATHFPIFDRRQGAFVTLTLHDRLRGCIGRIEAADVLRVVIPAVARSAAFSDPRFAPLGIGEFPDVRIEISLLSAPARLHTPDELVVGRDGVIIEWRGGRGLLLPQVAVEHAWGRDELLAHACAKASLPADAWRKGGVGILRFEAEVFREPAGDG
jgi:AmmeMemoRadiSam system protein A